MNNYEKLDLYEHNIEGYEDVKEVYANGGDVASVIRATGTGKSYISFALALDNKEKKIIYVVPSNAIKEHLIESINSNPNLSMEEDFPNLNIITYQSLVNMTKQELANLECDILILDEIHHLGAPIWGPRINTIVETHPNLIKFGMTAYPVRDRGTPYERDMTNPETEEIFSGSVVSYYDLCDAIIDGVLPKPIYKTVITENNEDLKEIEKLVNRLKEKNDSKYKEYEDTLINIKRMIHTSVGVKELIRKSVKTDGKYIYFCPVNSSEGKNDIDTIMNELKEYFIKYMDEENLVFYKSTSSDGKIGKLNRDSFYNDLDLNGNKVEDKLRIIFVKNQYNEGSHAPNIDGVFLGRHTNSDIVAFEQIGRALSVRGDTKKRMLEYQKYSIEELRKLALSREIPIEENASKEEIIEKLVAPIIIDLCDNIEFIKELEDNLKDRILEIREQDNRTKRKIKITNPSFDIEVLNIDILNVLSELKTRLARKTWDEMYELASIYYEHYGDSEIPARFKTINGFEYDEEGINLGIWLINQRKNYSKLTELQKEKLKLIEFRIGNKRTIMDWDEWYNLARIYYEHYGDSEIPARFKTKNGYEYDEEGVNLGKWIKYQREIYNKLTNEQKEKLKLIEFRIENKIKRMNLGWDEWYNLAKIYYEHHRHSEISSKFKTKNGYEYDKEGVNLGVWVKNQRDNYSKLTKEQQEKLDLIEFRIENKRTIMKWDEWYSLFKIYYEHHGHSEVPRNFKSKNGFEFNEEGVNLGNWIMTQRNNYSKLTKEQKEKLDLIEFRIENKITRMKWDEWYSLFKIYYEHHGHSEVPRNFKSKNGFEFNEEGVNLGNWITNQRNNYSKLTKEQKEKLDLIEFRESIKKNKEKLIKICEQYKIDYKKNKFLIENISYQEMVAKINYLIEQKRIQDEQTSIKEDIYEFINRNLRIFEMSGANMEMILGINKQQLIQNYYINVDKERGK